MPRLLLSVSVGEPTPAPTIPSSFMDLEPISNDAEIVVDAKGGVEATLPAPPVFEGFKSAWRKLSRSVFLRSRAVSPVVAEVGVEEASAIRALGKDGSGVKRLPEDFVASHAEVWREALRRNPEVSWVAMSDTLKERIIASAEDLAAQGFYGDMWALLRAGVDVPDWWTESEVIVEAAKEALGADGTGIGTLPESYVLRNPSMWREALRRGGKVAWDSMSWSLQKQILSSARENAKAGLLGDAMSLTAAGVEVP